MLLSDPVVAWAFSPVCEAAFRPRGFQNTRRVSFNTLPQARLPVPPNTSLKFVGFAGEIPCEVDGQFARFVFFEAMLHDEAREKHAIDAARDIMPRGDREERARVVVESHRVVEAGRLRSQLTKTHHALRRIVEPPRRPQPQRRIMPRE